ncbi:MAG TPA: hypothetical protein VHB21_05700, partial [Minicystis sp.]|nr:hypothetical protein [Minicystis sp.]
NPPSFEPPRGALVRDSMSTTTDEVGPAAAAREEPAPAADAPEPKQAPSSRPPAAPRAGSGRDAASFREWLDGRPLPPGYARFFGLYLPAMVLLGEMWRAHPFTIDDAFISYRYARNFAHGLGLVYNAGERIEGYTNFLWTVLLAGGIRLGLEPDTLAKVMGAASALGALAVTYALAGRLRSFRTAPCVATWLLATTIVGSGYAVFGLETPLFVLLVLGGLELFLRETGGVMRGKKARDDAPEPTAFPWSGLVFALAGLTRPEAPMYLGVPMLFLGRRFFGRQNLLRGALFAAPVAAHVLFRHAYYGTWLPNTLGAKTGNLQSQVQAGEAYIQNYVLNQGPVVWFALLGLAIAIVLARRDLLAIAALGTCVLVYVVIVGGDWMPYFRFMAPFEPLCFLLVDVGVRFALDRRERVTTLAIALFALFVINIRRNNLVEAQNSFITKEKRFWDMAAGGTANWFLKNGDPGEIAIGDIGFVGYKTNYPILDLLGLVDPVIAKLPGGYTQKLGPGFRDRFFEVGPKYLLLISSNLDCRHPSVPGSQVLYRDPRFLPRYDLAGKVPLDGGFAWCIYRDKTAPRAPASSVVVP